MNSSPKGEVCISPRGEVWVHKTSLTLPLFTEVSVPSLESEPTLDVCLEYPFYLCLFGVSILSLFVWSIHFVSVCLEYPFCLSFYNFALDFQTVLILKV